MIQTQIEEAEQLFNAAQYAKAAEICQQIAPILEAEEQWQAFVDVLLMQSECCWRRGETAEAIEKAEKSVSVSRIRFGEQDLNIANGYHHIGSAFLTIGDFDKAITYFERSLTIRQNKLGLDHKDTSTSFNNLGVCFVEKGYFDKAISHFQNCLKIRLAHYDKSHPMIAANYNNLGICYHKKGDYDLGIEYMERALNIRMSIHGENHLQTAMSINNIGVCYESKGDYDQSILYYKRSLKIRKSVFGNQHPDIAMNFNNVGICYEKMGDYDIAIYYHKRTLNLFLKIFGEHHPMLSECYNNLGACFVGKENFEQAITYFEKSINLRLKLLGEKHPDTALTYLNLGSCRQQNGDDPFTDIQNALNSLCLSYHNHNPLHNPTLSEYSSAPILLEVLTKKAKAFFLLFTNSDTPFLLHLLAAYNTYHLAVQLIDLMRGSYQAEGSKLLLAEKAKPVYDQAIQVNWEVHQYWQDDQYKPEMEIAFAELQLLHTEYDLPHPQDTLHHTFIYTEKCKAVLLFAAIKERHAQQTAGIPLHLKEEEYRLRVEINFIEKKIAEEQNEKEEERNEQVLLDLKSRLFDFKQQYTVLLKSFETDYPDYFQLKYQTQSVTIEQIQLPARAALLEFFVGEDYIYLFLLTPTDMLPAKDGGYCNQAVFQIPTIPLLDMIVTAFVRNIESFNNRLYVHQGYALYKLLLQNALQLLPPDTIDTLIIIPDGILTKLPFETLLTYSVKTSGSYDYPYLLQQYDIQYHFSATLWHYYRNRPSTLHPNPIKLNDFIGFAPVYSKQIEGSLPSEQQLPTELGQPSSEGKDQSTHLTDQNLNTPPFIRLGGKIYEALPESENELLGISTIFTQKGLSAMLMLHGKATLTNFIKLSERYKYVHIAAHSDYNDQYPDLTGILFSPDEEGVHSMLYLNDIFQLQLQAELLVLSCCETGLGEQKEGEGMMALNRGFLYAGAHNIIYTLFKVLDNPTSQLTRLLYQYVLEGLPYKKALTKAKLDMISQHYPPSYWSGFVLMGR